MKLTKSKVFFSKDNHDIEYVIYHEGADVDSLVQEWLKTTKDHSNQSLRDYIILKTKKAAFTRVEAKQLNIKAK